MMLIWYNLTIIKNQVSYQAKVYFVDINILYINIIIIEKIKKISGIKNNKSREIKVVSIIILLNNNFSLLLSD